MTNDVNVFEKQRRRGWRALCAGVGLIALTCGVWVWLDKIFAGNSSALADPSAMRLLGRLNVVFALLVIAGAIGIANGWLTVRSGKGNKALIWALVIVALSAFFTAVEL